MQIEFLTEACPRRSAAEAHIRDVYARCYNARVENFAPLLAAAFNSRGDILCAAGLRTSESGFFSDCYLDRGFSETLLARMGLAIDDSRIMEVTSLASTSPFPVLRLLDRMIGWGRDRGIVCGVFTATAPLRRLLGRTGLDYTVLNTAESARVANPEAWGSYYDADPQVCAFIENESRRASLSPHARMTAIQREVV